VSPLLQCKGLAVQRAGTTLFRLDCSIHQGEITVVLGPNGVGKSTLLLTMAGLIPTVGMLHFMERPLQDYHRQELARNIAWQGDLPPTQFGLTVAQRLALVTEGRDEVEAVALAADVASLLQRPLGNLSSGERQRVELAALMLRDAPLWLLDEPTSHLDLKHQIRVVAMLQQQAAKGRAIVVVLHDLQQAQALASQCILIRGRDEVVCGASGELFTAQRLSALFETPLIEQGSVLVPAMSRACIVSE